METQNPSENESLWDAMERLRLSTIHGLDQLDAHVDALRDQAPDLENKESVMSTTNPRECCWGCEAEPDHCRDVHCACHDFIAVTDLENRSQ